MEREAQLARRMHIGVGDMRFDTASRHDLVQAFGRNAANFRCLADGYQGARYWVPATRLHVSRATTGSRRTQKLSPYLQK